jgi:C4-type Zn-finger protein
MPAKPVMPIVTGLVQTPACSKCLAPMELARITPYTEGIEDRTYECPKCGHLESWVFKAPEPPRRTERAS